MVVVIFEGTFDPTTGKLVPGSGEVHHSGTSTGSGGFTDKPGMEPKRTGINWEVFTGLYTTNEGWLWNPAAMGGAGGWVKAGTDLTKPYRVRFTWCFTKVC